MSRTPAAAASAAWRCALPCSCKTGGADGRYRIVALIGHGGFGAVYQAELPDHPGQIVALKETFEPQGLRSFQSEFAVLSALRHPNLPRYDELFEADGNTYLVMEYVPGQSLQEALDRQGGPLLESAAGTDASVLVWRTSNYALAHRLRGHERPGSCLAWHPGGHVLASSGGNPFILLWHWPSGRLLSTVDAHDGGVIALAWRPDGALLASAGDDAMVRVWSVRG